MPFGGPYWEIAEGHACTESIGMKLFHKVWNDSIIEKSRLNPITEGGVGGEAFSVFLVSHSHKARREKITPFVHTTSRL